MSAILQLERKSTATYCVVITSAGELSVGLGDMDIHQQITEQYVCMPADLYVTCCLREGVWMCDKKTASEAIPGVSGCVEGTWEILKLTPDIGHWVCSMASYQSYLLLLTQKEFDL